MFNKTLKLWYVIGRARNVKWSCRPQQGQDLQSFSVTESPGSWRAAFALKTPQSELCVPPIVQRFHRHISTSKISIFHHIPSPETGIGCKEELGRVCNRSFSSVLLRPPRGTPLWSQHRPCMTTQAVEVGLKPANVNLIEHNLWDIVVSVWPVWRGWRNQAKTIQPGRSNLGAGVLSHV